MSRTWACVVANGPGVPLSTVVGGISLALRHARTAARLGWAGVCFVIPDEVERARVEALLAEDAPSSLELRIAAEEDAPAGVELVTLDASAIYLRDTLAAGSMKADFRIAGATDLPGARRFLFAQIRKSIQLDGVIAYYVQRPLARVLTRLLLPTPVSPNQVTLFALLCGLVGATFAALGGAGHVMIAGILYSISGIIDCVDGELARVRLQSSKLGEWLDSMTDETVTFSLMIGLGIGMWRDGYDPLWLAITLGGMVIGALSLGRIYLDLYREKLPIDTAQFRWFFDEESGEGATSDSPKDAGPSILAAFLNGFGYLIRRDANVTIITILLVLDHRRVAASIMGGAALALFSIVITHYIVMALRRRAT